MNNLRTEVRLFAESGDFDPDRLNYMDCPECDGKQKCMVVPAENGRGYYFKCFRDSCGVSGVTGGGLGRHMSTAKPLRATYPPPENLLCLTLPQYTWFKGKYGLTMQQVGKLAGGYDPKDLATIFPIRDPLGRQRGYVRRYFDNRQPKAPIRPYDEAGPLTAWYRPHNVSVYNAPLVLVEDQISAARLSSDVPTVALLGTHLTMGAQAEIIQWAKTHHRCPVIVSLDKDATTTGIALCGELQGLPGVWAYHVPLVECDVKDMDSTQYATYKEDLRDICKSLTNGLLGAFDGN